MNEAEMLQKAYSVARVYHGDQMYGDMPYLYHLLQVRDSVAGFGLNHQIVAMLHDVLEDTAYTETDLRMTFGQDVVDAVVAMTKLKGEYIVDYLARVMANDIAHVVKIHDTMCNLQESVKTKQWRRVTKYCKQLEILVEDK